VEEVEVVLVGDSVVLVAVPLVVEAHLARGRIKI
jgi:hypothetical protein